MPHSTVDDVAPPIEAAEEDIHIPDAPLANIDGVGNDGSADESQSRSIGDETPNIGPLKQEVKLEDLFNDDEEDDEDFPCSSAPAEDVGSSAPADPM